MVAADPQERHQDCKIDCTCRCASVGHCPTPNPALKSFAHVVVSFCESSTVPLLRHCPTPSPALRAVVFHCCPAIVSHYVASGWARSWRSDAVTSGCHYVTEQCQRLVIYGVLHLGVKRVLFVPVTRNLVWKRSGYIARVLVG